MADATFAVESLEGNCYAYSATIDNTDNNTEILTLKPNLEYSLGIDVGSSETLALKVSFSEVPATANLVTIDAAITADYTKVFDGGITGIEISGAVTNASTIYLIGRERV